MTTVDVESPLAIATRLAIAAGVPNALIDELYHLHARQWRLEDDARAPGASPDAVAAAKADIDRSNARRHRLIDLIDLIDAAVALPDAPAEPCRYYAETVGELCDRLLILNLKQRALAGLTTAPLPGEPANRTETEPICRHLGEAVTQLITDLAAGRAGLPPRVGVKVYNGCVHQEQTEETVRRSVAPQPSSTSGD